MGFLGAYRLPLEKRVPIKLADLYKIYADTLKKNQPVDAIYYLQTALGLYRYNAVTKAMTRNLRKSVNSKVYRQPPEVRQLLKSLKNVVNGVPYNPFLNLDKKVAMTEQEVDTLKEEQCKTFFGSFSRIMGIKDSRDDKQIQVQCNLSDHLIEIWAISSKIFKEIFGILSQKKYEALNLICDKNKIVLLAPYLLKENERISLLGELRAFTNGRKKIREEAEEAEETEEVKPIKKPDHSNSSVVVTKSALKKKGGENFLIEAACHHLRRLKDLRDELSARERFSNDEKRIICKAMLFHLMRMAQMMHLNALSNNSIFTLDDRGFTLFRNYYCHYCALIIDEKAIEHSDFFVKSFLRPVENYLAGRQCYTYINLAKVAVAFKVAIILNLSQPVPSKMLFSLLEKVFPIFQTSSRAFSEKAKAGRKIFKVTYKAAQVMCLFLFGEAANHLYDTDVKIEQPALYKFLDWCRFNVRNPAAHQLGSQKGTRELRKYGLFTAADLELARKKYLAEKASFGNQTGLVEQLS